MSWPEVCISSANGKAEKFVLPTEKFLGRASNSGFFAVLAGLLAPNGAAAGFFPVPFLTGGWSLRRGHQSSVTARTVDNAWLPGALMLSAPRRKRAQLMHHCPQAAPLRRQKVFSHVHDAIYNTRQRLMSMFLRKLHP
jgi:hypothetical protein